MVVLVLLSSFNRAARFARLVTQASVHDVRGKHGFNRAARFARLVTAITWQGEAHPREKFQ